MTNQQLHLYLKATIARLRAVAGDIDELDDPGERGLFPVWLHPERTINLDDLNNEMLRLIRGYKEGEDFEMRPIGINAAALSLDNWLDEFDEEIATLLDSPPI